MAMWGKTKFAFGKYEKEKMSYKTVFEKDPSYVSWCRKHLVVTPERIITLFATAKNLP